MILTRIHALDGLLFELGIELPGSSTDNIDYLPTRTILWQGKASSQSSHLLAWSLASKRGFLWTSMQSKKRSSRAYSKSCMRNFIGIRKIPSNACEPSCRRPYRHSVITRDHHFGAGSTWRMRRSLRNAASAWMPFLRQCRKEAYSSLAARRVRYRNLVHFGKATMTQR